MSPGATRFRPCNRLKRPREYKNVFSSRYRSTDKQFLILAINNNREYARLGLAVPKKYIPGSVQRNRVKRVIRECFRHRQASLSGLDMVVVVRGAVNDISLEKFNSILDSHWKKLIKCKPC